MKEKQSEEHPQTGKLMQTEISNQAVPHAEKHMTSKSTSILDICQLIYQ